MDERSLLISVEKKGIHQKVESYVDLIEFDQMWLFFECRKFLDGLKCRDEARLFVYKDDLGRYIFEGCYNRRNFSVEFEPDVDYRVWWARFDDGTTIGIEYDSNVSLIDAVIRYLKEYSYDETKIEKYVKEHGIRVFWNDDDCCWYAEVDSDDNKVCLAGDGSTPVEALWSLIGALEISKEIELDR